MSELDAMDLDAVFRGTSIPYHVTGNEPVVVLNCPARYRGVLLFECATPRDLMQKALDKELLCIPNSGTEAFLIRYRGRDIYGLEVSGDTALSIGNIAGADKVIAPEPPPCTRSVDGKSAGGRRNKRHAGKAGIFAIGCGALRSRPLAFFLGLILRQIRSGVEPLCFAPLSIPERERLFGVLRA